jgi:phage tail tube protein FII
MARRQTYFEQVPIELALRVARQEARKSTARLVSCAICKMAVELEYCKIDEDGEPVHESCYIAKLAAHHRSKAS